MSITIKPSYGGAKPVTITNLASLSNGACRQLPALDNSADLFLDVAIEFAFLLAAGVVTAGKVRIWVYGSISGTIYSTNIDGTDKAYTLEPTNDLTQGAERSCDNYSGATIKGFIPSLAGLFNGIMPERWGVIVENASGVAFGATGHTLNYFGIQAQGV